MNQSIGDVVRKLRDRLGWSQNKLAREVDTAQQTINRIEAGKQKPGWDLACRLADALGVSLDTLRGSSGDGRSIDKPKKK